MTTPISAHDEQYTKRVRSDFKLSKKKKREVALIAGVAGFVGSRIAEAFTDVGIQVIGIDNYISGKHKYLERLIGRSNFEVFEANIQEGLPIAFNDKQVSYVIDALNVYPHIGHTEFGLNELLNNSIALKNLLEFANTHGSRVIFTSSVDIYQGLASHEYLQNYYDGRELTTYYEYLEGKRYGEALCREYIDKYGVDVRIARIAEVYGPRMDLSSSSVLARAIRLALDGKDLVFDEDGSQQHQLVYIDDLVYGVLKLAFAEEERIKGGIFYFVNPEQVSTLSVAYTLRELTQKNLKVEFIPQHRKVGYPPPQKIDISRTMKFLRWNPKIDVTKGLELTLEWFVERSAQQEATVVQSSVPEVPVIEDDSSLSEIVIGETPKPVEEPVVDASEKKGWLALSGSGEKGKIPHLTLKRTHVTLADIRTYVPDILLGIGLFFILVVTPLVLALGFGWRGMRQAREGNYVRAEELLSQSSTLFQYYQKPSEWLGMQDMHRAISNTLMAGIYGAQFMTEGQSMFAELAPVMNLLHSSLADNADGDAYSVGELYSYSSKALIDYRSAQTWFLLMKQSLDSVVISDLPKSIQDEVRDITELATQVEPIVSNGNRVLANSDILLGFDRPKRYLVWLQNSSELRPTGGFIGSYAALTISRGQVTEFKVDDIYNPDGLLSPHNTPQVDPILSEYLNVEYYGTRDANWWIDYPTSAQLFIDLYERATDEKIDGVVALNLSVIEDMLKAMGPVTVESLNETVTYENLFEKTEVHAEIGFEPGSTQKRDFLGALTQQVITNLGSADDVTWNALFGAIGKRIVSGDVMVYLSDPSFKSTLSRMHINGEMVATEGDYLRVVDSNIGGNKVNKKVERSSNYSVDIDRGGALHSVLQVTWNNTATSATWPMGDYINYVRIYIPKEAQGIEVDPPLEKQSIFQEFGRGVVAGVITVPVNSTSKLRVRYDLPEELSLANNPTYILTWEGQPGVEKEQVDFTLNLPVFLSSTVQTNYSRTLSWPLHIEIPVNTEHL